MGMHFLFGVVMNLFGPNKYSVVSVRLSLPCCLLKGANLTGHEFIPNGRMKNRSISESLLRSDIFSAFQMYSTLISYIFHHSRAHLLVFYFCI